MSRHLWEETFAITMRKGGTVQEAGDAAEHVRIAFEQRFTDKAEAHLSRVWDEAYTAILRRGKTSEEAIAEGDKAVAMMRKAYPAKVEPPPVPVVDKSTTETKPGLVRKTT